MLKKLLFIIPALMAFASFSVAQCTTTVTAQGSTTFCQGDSLALTAGPSNAYGFQWYLNGVAISGANDSILEVHTSGSYSVVDSIGSCVATSSTVTVVVNPLPVVSITPGSSVAICSGGSVTLNGSALGTGISYQWQLNNMNVVGATSTTYVANAAGVYTLHVVNSNGCASSASDTLTMNTAPATPALSSNSSVCLGDTMFLYYTNPPSLGTYSWTGPSSFSSSAQNPVLANAVAADAGTYTLTVTVPSCSPVSGTISVAVASCDSVWPGDVNSDHTVDNQDALDLALGYSSTGAVRTGASISWVPQYCANWGTTIVAGVDMKHADCDGNGTVDANDTAAINANYGLTHPKGQHQSAAKITGYPDLYFDLTGVNLVAGTTVTIPIKLGTTSVPMNNILGLAAQVKITGVSLATNASISYPISWLGNSTNTFSFRKPVTTGRIDWAYARKDHQNISGNGTIANLTFTIPPNTNTQQMILYFENVKMIGNAGNVITSFNTLDDTSSVGPSAIANVAAQSEYYNLVPNPSGAQCQLEMFFAQQANIVVKITDVTGKVVWVHTEENVKGATNVALPAPTITSGIYMIHVQTNGLSSTVLKWVRN